MIRSFLFMLAVSAVISTGGFPLYAQETPEQFEIPVGNMVIKAPSQFKAKKKPVFFTHSNHLRFSCLDCHHTWDRKGPVTGCTASGCHEKVMPSAPKGKPSQEQSVMSLTGAFHRACRSCHKEQLAELGDPAYTGPIACDGCHNDAYKDQDYEFERFDLPLGMIKIEPPEEVDAKRSAVSFSHSLHFQQDCQTCHHNWDGTEEIMGCMTSGCHDQFEPDEASRDINNPDNVLYYLSAYHNTCYKCHINSKKAGADVPIQCNACHNSD